MGRYSQLMGQSPIDVRGGRVHSVDGAECGRVQHCAVPNGAYQTVHM